MKAALLSSLLGLATTICAQEGTDRSVAAAIQRLHGDRTDREALVVLIDAGGAAAEPLATALEQAVADQDERAAGRMLRALRALGPEAADQSPRLFKLFTDRATEDGQPDALLGAVADCACRLAWSDPEHLQTLRTALRRLELTKFPMHVLIGRVDLLRVVRRLQVEPLPAPDQGPDVSLGSENLLDREFAADAANGAHHIPSLVKAMRSQDHPIQIRLDLGRTTGASLLGAERAHALIHDAAARAIARLDPEHPEAVAGLVLQVFRADDPRDRVRAMRSLGQRGEAVRDDRLVRNALLAGLDDPSHELLLAETITACGMIGVRDDTIRLLLESFARDPRGAIAQRAASVLRTWD